MYAFPLTGVRPLRAAYQKLVDRLGIDAIVLVDGGTDILLRGDESGLGTPAEDMTSLGAVAGLDTVPTRIVACIGFGIDAHHGVNHTEVLENIADLDAAGAYLGAFSVPSRSAEHRRHAPGLDAHRGVPGPGRDAHSPGLSALRPYSGSPTVIFHSFSTRSLVTSSWV